MKNLFRINKRFAFVHFPFCESVSHSTTQEIWFTHTIITKKEILPYTAFERLMFLDFLRRTFWQRSKEITLGESFADYLEDLGFDKVSNEAFNAYRTGIKRFQSMSFQFVPDATYYVYGQEVYWMFDDSTQTVNDASWVNRLKLDSRFYGLVRMTGNASDSFLVNFRFFQRVADNALAIDLLLHIFYRLNTLRPGKTAVTSVRNLRDEFDPFSREENFCFATMKALEKLKYAIPLLKNVVEFDGRKMTFAVPDNPLELIRNAAPTSSL